MVQRTLCLIVGLAVFGGLVTFAAAQQPDGSAEVPTVASGPVLAIDEARVDGRQVRLRVTVSGATLASTTDTSMGTSQRGGMDMSGMSMSMDHGAMHGSGASGGHLHVYLDGTMLLMVTQTEITLVDVPSGTHEVRVDLTDNLHQPYSPPVQATTSVVVP